MLSLSTLHNKQLKFAENDSSKPRALCNPKLSPRIKAKKKYIVYVFGSTVTLMHSVLAKLTLTI